MHTVSTDRAPAAIGPYSQAKICGNFVFTSGQIPADPKTGAIAERDITGQTRQVCENIKGLLEAAGTSIDKVVKTTCFLADIADFTDFNDVYKDYFTSSPRQKLRCSKGHTEGVPCRNRGHSRTLICSTYRIFVD